MRDQIAPAEIAYIAIVPPEPGSRSDRGWEVRAFARGEHELLDESYACSSAAHASFVAEKLLTGQEVSLSDCITPAITEPGGRPHAAR